MSFRPAYLHRLGLDAEPRRLRPCGRSTASRWSAVPYETMWIQAGEIWGIDPVDSVARIALHGRGGYCYHLNGALGELLNSLGYAVSGHVGAVHGPSRTRRDVDGQPSCSHGPGDCSQMTIRRGSGTSTQVSATRWMNHCLSWLGCIDKSRSGCPLRNRAWRTPSGISRMIRPAASPVWVGMPSERNRPISTAKHHWLSTSPESPFAQSATAERRDATGIDVMRGLVSTRTPRRPLGRAFASEREQVVLGAG